MVVRACVVVACIATSAFARQYTANFSTTSYDCGASLGCPIKSYPLYDSLYFYNISDSFQMESGSGNCYGICAHSPEFYGVIAGGNIGSISANYDGSRVRDFDLSSFWTGCQALQTGPSSGTAYLEPAACNITISGYDSSKGKLPPASAKPKAIQTFQYVPTLSNNPQGLPRAFMTQFAAKNSFKGLRIITFTASARQSAPGQPGIQGPPSVYLDDLVYEVRNKG